MSEPRRHRRDPGLQPERTTLAWRRVAIAFVGVGLASLKVTAQVLGPFAVATAALLVGGAAILLAGSHRRYLDLHQRLSGRFPPPDGRLLLLTASIVVLVAVTGLAFVLGNALR